MTTTRHRHGAGERLGRIWNWKSALMSALLRAPIFFLANVQAGMDAATAAFATEFAYRAVSAGFYGALTSFFARRRSARAATLQAVIVMPALAHGLEYLVHASAGTPHIASALAASVAVSMCTTRFSLFLMRRDLFIPGRQSFADDLRGLVRLSRMPLTALRRRLSVEPLKSATR